MATLLVVMVVSPWVQARQLGARANGAVIEGVPERLDMLVGRSTVIRMDRPITRVSLSTPDIADALVTSSYELLVHGKTPGTISLLVWGDNGKIKSYDVSVRRDLSVLEAQVRQLFPGEPITVASNGKDVVLSGVVSSKYIVDRASSLAVGYVEKAESVVNLLRQQEGVATDQVLLRVRFAEVSRSAVQELGASFFTGGNGKGDWIGRTTTQQFPAPEFDKEKGLVFSDFLNLFAFNTEEQLGLLVKALKTRGLFQSLAEPNLITQDGKEASFLAGGEYPYPVVQGSGGNASVSITFKEFGVRLRFTPTVLGNDLIHLKVAPEVSTLDFTNAITLQGFRVPSLSTRRTETEVELLDGQTFAIAGLLDNRVNQTLSKVPGIGDIPILGYLFKSRAYQKNATELVVMITPHIVRRGSAGVTPNLPGLVEPFLAPEPRRLPAPAPAFTSPESRQGQALPPALGSSGPTAVGPATAVATPSPASAIATPVVSPADRTPAKSERQALEKASDQERTRLKDEGERAEEARKRDEERGRQAAAADAKRLERERQQAELAHQEDAKRQAAQRKIDEKRGQQQAEVDRQHAETAQKQAAVAREVAEKIAKEEARGKADQAKVDQARAAEDRKQSEKRRKAEEQLAAERAKSDAEMARRNAEVAKMIAQYRMLTKGDSSSAPAAGPVNDQAH